MNENFKTKLRTLMENIKETLEKEKQKEEEEK